MVRRLALTLALVAAACEQGNGDPTGPTVVTATATASTSTTPPPPPPPPPPSGDAGSDAGDAGSCDGYASPTTPASCHASCTAGCNPNGCFGTYYCELGALKCVPKPASCP